MALIWTNGKEKIIDFRAWCFYFIINAHFIGLELERANSYSLLNLGEIFM